MRKQPPPFNDVLPIIATLVVHAALSSEPTLVPQWWNENSEKLTPDTMVAVLFALNFGVIWVWTGILSVLDHCGFVDPFRIQPKVQPMPVKDQLHKLAPLVLFNQLLIGPVSIWASVQAYIHLSTGSLTAAWPTQAEFVRGVVLCGLAGDFAFFWSHYAFHKIPFLYKHIHKIHHSMAAPVAVESVYAHPVEHALQGIGVHLIGAVLFGCHPLSWMTFMTVGTMIQVHNHCGFWLPFLPRPLFHDYHHSTNSSCFGGPSMVFDYLMGTLGNYQKWEQQLSEGVLDEM